MSTREAQLKLPEKSDDLIFEDAFGHGKLPS